VEWEDKHAQDVEEQKEEKFDEECRVDIDKQESIQMSGANHNDQKLFDPDQSNGYESEMFESHIDICRYV